MLPIAKRVSIKEKKQTPYLFALNACEFVLIVRRRHVCGTEVMI
jgi:hypothetical protein